MKKNSTKEIELKKYAISTFKIAEINLLMSFKDINPQNINKKILPSTNPICWIIGHCFAHLDWYLSMFSGKRVFPKEQDEYFAYGVSKELINKGFPFSFKEIVNRYLQLSESFIKYLEGYPKEKYNQVFSKEDGGETLLQKIQRLSLHYLGHTGQITLIRRALGEKPWGFVGGTPEEERRKLVKIWITWWEESKEEFK